MGYRRLNYERPEPGDFPASAYVLRGDRYAIAWRILGWHTEPDEDTDWSSGFENRTGDVVAVMVGDDELHRYQPGDFEPLADLDYCLECGQVGCTHDGRDRSELEHPTA